MKSESEFTEHVEEQQEAVTNALNELTKIRAYTLSPQEVCALKAAQYALRDISEEHTSYDISTTFSHRGTDIRFGEKEE